MQLSALGIAAADVPDSQPYNKCHPTWKVNVTTAVCFSSPLNLLTTQIPSIVRALHRHMREKSVKTRQVVLVEKKP